MREYTINVLCMFSFLLVFEEKKKRKKRLEKKVDLRAVCTEKCTLNNNIEKPKKIFCIYAYTDRLCIPIRRARAHQHTHIHCINVICT